MKYLIPLILFFPSLAFAVDDAVINEIDVKASSANAKADSNNSRIQALEIKDAELEMLKADTTLVELKEREVLKKVSANKSQADGNTAKAAANKKLADDNTALIISRELEVLKKVAANKTQADGNTAKAAANKTQADGNSGRIGTLEADIGALVAEDIVLHGKIDTVASDLAAIELITGPEGPAGPQGPAGADGASLPVGASAGDILYWNGSVWQLTPAPPVDAATPPTLTLITGVPTWTSTGAAVVYDIGDTGPAGGIVFYITDGGLHGLEAAPVDQTSAPWGCEGTELVGADRTAVGAGANNTADILSGCAETGSAADMADAYTLNGYYDWFLPSKDELNLLHQQKDVVGGFASDVYWSSSENGEDGSLLAWWQDFCDCPIRIPIKSFTHGVRAVRAF